MEAKWGTIEDDDEPETASSYSTPAPTPRLDRTATPTESVQSEESAGASKSSPSTNDPDSEVSEDADPFLLWFAGTARGYVQEMLSFLSFHYFFLCFRKRRGVVNKRKGRRPCMLCSSKTKKRTTPTSFWLPAAELAPEPSQTAHLDRPHLRRDLAQ